MQSFAEQIKKLREKKGDPLRTVAAFLNIDQAILSKIEHGKRRASKEQVLKLSEYFELDKEELLVSWLSDNIAYEIANEELAEKAMKVAEQKIKYLKQSDK